MVWIVSETCNNRTVGLDPEGQTAVAFCNYLILEILNHDLSVPRAIK